MKKAKRPRGTGSVYPMKGTKVFWIKYHRNGEAIRESSGETCRKKAEKVLQKRLAEVAVGTFLGPKLEKVPVSELAEDLLRDYRINGRKSIDDVEARWKLHLKPFLGFLRAVQVTSSLVQRYIDKRQEEGAKNATINRELAALKRMFNLGRESTPPKVREVPYIPMLKEDNVRTGFMDMKQHDSLARECAKVGLWLTAVFEVGYTYGWRHEEVLRLKVSQLDFFAKTIRLEPGTTKNDDGREVAMTQPVFELLSRCAAGKGPDDWLFTRTDGKPVKDFRAAWDKVCLAAGVPGLLFHDLRRTAARNLRKAGVAETVIMKIGGWKTRTVFERYAIVNTSDMKEAMQTLEVEQKKANAKLAEAQAQELGLGQSLGRVANQKASCTDEECAPSVLPN
jgi:integrase